MGGCCDLKLWLSPDKKTLICKQCSKEIDKERKENPKTHRCMWHLSCAICGREKLIDCGTRLRVYGNGFDKLVTMK